jgi:hypothetical protein
MNKIIVNLEGEEYQIDIQKAKELGVLKEKDTKCKSWESFCDKYAYKTGFYFDEANGKIDTTVNPIAFDEQLTEEETNAMVAFSKLLKLRRDWIGNWDPDWTRNIEKYSIVCENNIVDVMLSGYITHPFSFPTKKMAKEFLKCFKDLFEQCKCLI